VRLSARSARTDVAPSISQILHTPSFDLPIPLCYGRYGGIGAVTLVFTYGNCPCSSRPRRDAVATRREAFLPPSSRARKQATDFILSAIFPHDATQSAILHSKSSPISRHTPREIIALTHSKQTTGGTISRHKTRTRLNAISSRNRLGKARSRASTYPKNVRAAFASIRSAPDTLSRTICYMIKFTPLACGAYQRHCGNPRRNHGSRAFLRNDEWRGDA
jgi:hypothetical protein